MDLTGEGNLFIIALSALVMSAAQASVPPPNHEYPPAWSQPVSPQTQQPSHHHRHLGVATRIRPKYVVPTFAARDVVQLRADVAALRRELASVRAEVGRPPDEKPLIFQMAALFPGISPVKAATEPVGFPNLGPLGDPSAPSEPPSMPLPGRSSGPEALDEVRTARAYLVRTATIGFTMARQGVETAIGRLHPDFAVRLAEAIERARKAGLGRAGVFSAYRPPAFGVGGFSNKFNSLHSYGLAADVTGIGGPGSASAHLWQKIVRTVGLFLPYGPNNHAEFNHTQEISSKVAAERLRGTITSTQPKDLERMWLASGVTAHVHTPIANPVASSEKLPIVDWSQ